VVVANIDYKSLKRMRRPMLHRLKARLPDSVRHTGDGDGQASAKLLGDRPFEMGRDDRRRRMACLTFRKKSPNFKIQRSNEC